MKTYFVILLIYLFFNCSLFSQTEIKPSYDARLELDKFEKIDVIRIDAMCTKSPLKVFSIDSQRALISFYSKYGIDDQNCALVDDLKIDFTLYDLLFVGLGIGGNQKSKIDFFVSNNTLYVICIITGPENVDYSLNTVLKFFVVKKGYNGTPIFNVRYEKQ